MTIHFYLTALNIFTHKFLFLPRPTSLTWSLLQFDEQFLSSANCPSRCNQPIFKVFSFNLLNTQTNNISICIFPERALERYSTWQCSIRLIFTAGFCWGRGPENKSFYNDAFCTQAPHAGRLESFCTSRATSGRSVEQNPCFVSLERRSNRLLCFLIIILLPLTVWGWFQSWLDLNVLYDDQNRMSFWIIAVLFICSKCSDFFSIVFVSSCTEILAALPLTSDIISVLPFILEPIFVIRVDHCLQLSVSVSDTRRNLSSNAILSLQNSWQLSE